MKLLDRDKGVKVGSIQTQKLEPLARNQIFWNLTKKLHKIKKFTKILCKIFWLNMIMTFEPNIIGPYFFHWLFVLTLLLEITISQNMT